jgi:predicted DNA binding CopG/RHH family protein
MKKNSHLHILIETPLLNKVKDEAHKRGLSLGQFCRQKLRKHDQLDRIEGKLDRTLKKG